MVETLSPPPDRIGGVHLVTPFTILSPWFFYILSRLCDMKIKNVSIVMLRSLVYPSYQT